MPARTNEFQRLIAGVQSHLDPGSAVTESAMLADATTGTKREVDVAVSGHVGGQAVLVSIECRDRSRGPDVTWVDEMHAKHSRLPTNVLVLVSHKSFTPEALRVAQLYGIRCLVLDDVDPTAQDRLFPDVRSLWGKAWELTIERAELLLGAWGNLDAEHFRASPDTELFLDDGATWGSAADFAHALARSQPVIDKMSADADPEHTFLVLNWERPEISGRRICVQKLDPPVLRPIDLLSLVVKCVVTLEEFPLRHGLLDGLRLAWGSGAILGKPAMVIATAAAADSTKVTLRLSQESPGKDWPAAQSDG